MDNSLSSLGQASSSSTSDADPQTNPNIVVLQHPSGSKVYICATAHISASSQKDVEAIIEAVGPAIVVLELDPERMRRLTDAVQFGDRLGLKRFQSTTSFKIMSMAISGELLAYASGLLYVCTGALMGTRPGGEFLAAAEAAQRVGALVVFGDRSQQVTMRRLQWYTQKLMEAEQQQRAGGVGSGSGIGDLSSRAWPTRDAGTGEDSTITANTSNSNDAQIIQSEINAAVDPDDNPWGLSDDDASEAAIKARLLRMMREGGCPHPNAVLEAAQRLLRNGLDPNGRIAPQDVLEVRSCGSTLIERFRERAMGGDDAWIKEFEIESLTGAKGALGAQRSGQAMRKVIIDERDWLLARRLWEAGEQAGGQPVVGVCGAGHVRGIQRYWDVAGTPEAAARAAEYSALPPGAGPPSAMGMVFTGGVLAYMAVKRPKVMGFFVGAMAMATAPYLGFSVYTMKRLTSFADKLAATCDQIESSGDMASGWPQENEWQ